MASLRTTDSTIDELLDGIEQLGPREQAAILDLAEKTEKIGRKTDFSSERTQAWLADRIVRKQRAIEYEHAAAELYEELSAAGVDVFSLLEMQDMDLSESAVVPILARTMRTTDNFLLRQHIIQILGSTWAGVEAKQELLDYFKVLDGENDPHPNDLRGSIVESLQRHSDAVGSQTFIDIASNPENGFARVRAIAALGRFHIEREQIAEHLLVFLASDDPELYLPAAEVLGNWKVRDARDRIAFLIATVDERRASRLENKIDRNFELDELRKALWKNA